MGPRVFARWPAVEVFNQRYVTKVKLFREQIVSYCIFLCCPPESELHIFLSCRLQNLSSQWYPLLVLKNIKCNRQKRHEAWETFLSIALSCVFLCCPLEAEFKIIGFTKSLVCVVFHRDLKLSNPGQWWGSVCLIAHWIIWSPADPTSKCWFPWTPICVGC